MLVVFKGVDGLFNDLGDGVAHFDVEVSFHFVIKYCFGDIALEINYSEFAKDL